MKVSDLKRIQEAPVSGQMLVYARDRVFFEPYESIAAAVSQLEGKDLLEVHLFDRQKEYRALFSRMQNGPVEHLADFKKDENTYQEHLLLNVDGYQNTRLSVLNHIRYDDENDSGRTGMLEINDYRMYLEADHE